MLEHSGDSQEAVLVVDSDVALALAGVCYSCSAQQTEKSVDAQQYEATQPNASFATKKKYQRRLGFVYRLWGSWAHYPRA
jgi:Fe-S cluster biogenesis protein NfuA